MYRKSRIQVLRGFEPLAHSLLVYNAERYNRGTHSSSSIRRNVLLAIGCTVFVLSLIVVSVLNLLACCSDEMDWTERDFHFGLMLGQLQQLFIFTAMTRGNRQFIEALHQLQRTVDSRESWEIMFRFDWNWPRATQLIYSTFISASITWTGVSQTHSIYAQIEGRYASCLDTANIIFVVTIAINNGLPLLQPIFYVIFGHPEPSRWVLPNGFRWTNC